MLKIVKGSGSSRGVPRNNFVGVMDFYFCKIIFGLLLPEMICWDRR
jgi:hypothetical protein